jgi:hypothetical protein
VLTRSEILHLREHGDRIRAVEQLIRGEIIADEEVDLETRALRYDYPLERVQALQRELHALGVILPAAMPGAPLHVAQSRTILNVWTEQPPDAPLRRLVHELRRRGKRALAGTSANLTGQPTITEPDEVVAVFGQRVSAILPGRLRRGAAGATPFGVDRRFHAAAAAPLPRRQCPGRRLGGGAPGSSSRRTRDRAGRPARLSRRPDAEPARLPVICHAASSASRSRPSP